MSIGKQILSCFLHFTFIWLILLISVNAKQNSTSPRYYLHSIVDTASNPEIKQYINHWVDYLYTFEREEQNKFWSPEDIQSWGRPLFQNLFQIPPEQFLRHLPPFILSVYCKDDFCRIATSFIQPGFRPSDTSSQYNQSPFGIIEIGVFNKEGKLYLTHLFDRRTAGYKRLYSGKLKYLIDPNLTPDQNEITQTKAFIDSLSGLFDIETDTITFVVCRDPNELGYVLGFNFFFAGYTTGMAQYQAMTVFSGLGSFTYPHEIAHLVIDPVIEPGSRFIGEGRATYFGGSGDKTYTELLESLSKHYSEISNQVFKDIIRYPGSPQAYTLGAMLIDVILEQKGIEGLKHLSESPTDPMEIMAFVAEILEIEMEELFAEINKRL